MDKLFTVEVLKVEDYTIESTTDVWFSIGVNTSEVENAVYKIAESVYPEVWGVKATEVFEIDGYSVLLDEIPTDEYISILKRFNEYNRDNENDELLGAYIVDIYYGDCWSGYGEEVDNIIVVAKTEEDAKANAIKKFKETNEDTDIDRVFASNKHIRVNKYNLVFEKLY